MGDRSTARGRGPRTTKRSVYTVERLASSIITVGGLGTIVSVSLIFFYLLWVVAPLFRGVRSEDAGRFAVASAQRLDSGFTVQSGVDDDRLLAWFLEQDGTVEGRRLDTGEVLDTVHLFEGGEPPRAVSFRPGDERALFGFADGSLRWAEIGFRARLLSEDEERQLPHALRALEVGKAARFGPTAMVLRTRAGPIRATDLVASPGEELDTGRSSSVSLVAHTVNNDGPLVLALFDDGVLEAYRFRERENMLTGEVTRERSAARLPTTPENWIRPPSHLALSSVGLDAYLIWSDGTLEHFDLRDFRQPSLIETVDLVEPQGQELELFGLGNGGTTLIASHGGGQVEAWFPIEDSTSSLRLLRRVHRYPSAGARATCLATSKRSRCFAVGTEDGRVLLYQMTTEQRLAEVAVLDQAVREIAFAPKENGLVVRGASAGARLDLELGYPEASLAALTRPLWYEGYSEPTHVWQSTGSDDGSEPKLGLWPLVFGTLKATFFSMLFGAPLALLAAIFSSEFLAPRLHSPIKATIELMASLPSVVLGFLAAMVFAPFVERSLAFVLTSFLVVPAAVLLGAYSWQLVPHGLALRVGGARKFMAIAATLPIGLVVSWLFAPRLERLWFGGDVMAWLNGRGSACAGAWAYLFLPACVIGVSWCSARWLQPWIAGRSIAWERHKVALVDLAKALAIVLMSLLASGSLGVLLEARGFDPRDSLFGPYDTRNALVVGFVMGFAIIPIIFTLADDALAEVPGHLREASLGAGATPWQTAVRVVVPTAMSGLFSAVMIGLGRAVGETMIVLMAAGSTPILELNVFNGFRTLSANIATELPEAVHGSAHYRTLFLAALTLFGMTFAVNSAAEAVRRHFRKKAVSL